MAHYSLAKVLTTLGDGGIGALDPGPVDEYLKACSAVDPDTFGRDEALAYWINLYNAGALRLAIEAGRTGAPSVLRVPGGFQRPFITVAGEDLSLDAVEHGKVRRFKDPRVHAALVCGAVSCPTLRYEPYGGDHLDAQLDHQMRRFLAAGGAVYDEATGELRLSRIFRWFGGDFTRPAKMPTFLPARGSKVAERLRAWMPADLSNREQGMRPKVTYLDYDWTLGCSVA